ncbi:MAG: hypothetical protein IKF36_05450 [Bacilli bacterium]|nr:hypothetical protein [Bacilli bacterium]
MKFYDYLEENKDKVIDIYFDMDGVFAEYDIGNFDYNTIRPIKSSIKVIEDLYNKGLNVNILSICKNNRIVEEKYEWMSKYLPFFSKDKMNFISKEEIQGVESNDLKSNFLREKTQPDHITIIVDDDITVIKKIVKENENVKVFHVISIIE